MIKIPQKKYLDTEKGLDLISEHFECIELYLKDSIQFYINCCDIMQNRKTKFEYNMLYYNNENTLRSLISVISNKKYKDIKNLSDAINDVKQEFKLNSKKIRGFLNQLLNNNLNILQIRKIVKCKPREMVIVNKRVYKCCKNIKVKNNRVVTRKGKILDSVLKEILYKIFNYDKFIGSGFNYMDRKNIIKIWNAYELCQKLNVNVCPYCNRIYTFTVKKTDKNIIRPELDHYFPRSKFPIFALSFYNLIPSCKICNSSLKGDKELDIEKNLHPYLDEINESYKFYYEPIDYSIYDGDKQKVKITVRNVENIKCSRLNDKSYNNIKFFRIEDIYKQHNDIVAKLLLTRKKYEDSMLEEIKDTFTSNGKNITKEELINDIFQNLDENEIIDVSLGKFKKDIIQELKESIYNIY